MEKELPLPTEGEASQRKGDLMNFTLRNLQKRKIKLLQKNIHKKYSEIYITSQIMIASIP